MYYLFIGCIPFVGGEVYGEECCEVEVYGVLYIKSHSLVYYVYMICIWVLHNLYMSLYKLTETPDDSILSETFGATLISKPKIMAPVWLASLRSLSERGPIPVLTIYILNCSSIIFSASDRSVSRAPA